MMGKINRGWEGIDYVLSCFGKGANSAKEAYARFVEGGIRQGRREELIGGGLIRSIGGWNEVKRLKEKRQAHVMSDERILGDSDFVDSLLSRADERSERHYKLKRLGYNLDKIAEKVAEIYGWIRSKY
jgi:hypothetical protein